MQINTSQFRKYVWSYYRKNGRHTLPWRKKSVTPYEILVSEIMLQQTQVDRVIPKYKAFLKSFPNFKQLAEAPFPEVLRHWSGLGYNRRALNLHRTAKIVRDDFSGRLPRERDTLTGLPGIGAYTVSAIRVFAFGIPDTMIETNIRTVFLHHFFADKKMVHDKEVIRYIEVFLDTENPREWYWALMDYGAHIKKTVGNLNTQSAHYSQQSKFEGSHRQLRGNILKLLGEKPATARALAQKLKKPVSKTLTELQHEGFIKKQNNKLALA